MEQSLPTRCFPPCHLHPLEVAGEYQEIFVNNVEYVLGNADGERSWQKSPPSLHGQKYNLGSKPLSITNPPTLRTEVNIETGKA